MMDVVCFSGKPLDLGFDEVRMLSTFKAVAATHEDIVRKALSSRKTDFVYNLEINAKKDKVNRRSSGLHQVFCSLAKEHDIAIAFNFNVVMQSSEPSVILGRMMQNVRLCRKYQLKMILASFARHPSEMCAPQALLAFGRSIGMTGKEAKDALHFKKKSSLIVALGKADGHNNSNS